MVNFLALLGWSPGDDRELMSRRGADEQLRARRDQRRQRRVQYRQARLDERAVHRAAAGGRAGDSRSAAARRGGTGRARRSSRTQARFTALLELLRPRAKRFTDFVEQARPLLWIRSSTNQRQWRNISRSRDWPATWLRWCRRSATPRPFDEPHVEARCERRPTDRGIKAGSLIHATRVAITGRTASPGLFEMIALLGREGTLGAARALLDLDVAARSQ